MLVDAMEFFRKKLTDIDAQVSKIKREIKNETPPNQPSQPQQRTLEEEVVAKMAPIGKSELAVFTPSTFKPVATNVNGASSI